MANDSVAVVIKDYHLGTKEWSWKYNSIFSLERSAQTCTDQRFCSSNGVKMVYFSLIFALVLQIYSVNGER